MHSFHQRRTSHAGNRKVEIANLKSQISNLQSAMNQQRAQQLINNFAGKRLVVLGDLMLDEFVWGQVRRISPEAPVPVVEVKRESWQLGGAGNVVANLLALGAQATPIGLIGADQSGERLLAAFAARGAETAGIVRAAARPTTLKTRIVAHSQQMLRADREDRSPINADIEEQLLAAFERALDQADAVIISDYEKGLLTPRLLQATIAATQAQAKPVCLDPKIKHFLHYRNVDLITPNQLEAERAANLEITDEASLMQAATCIRELLACRNVLITRGEHGMSLLDQRGALTHIPAVAREVYDVTGAGDTVIATLTLALTAGAQLSEAALLANHAAGVVVGKIGTATVSPAELLASLG
jgi:D-beta-D-heptose 7-phosphate kinase/D-beta-D-heptose 1-phosphate adenosyltransferase